MKVKIKQFDPSLPAPGYQTNGAACVDLYARIETVIPAKSVGYIPLNVALEIPEGYWVLVAARSSTHKQGVMAANGIAIGDSDFCGDGDEYHFPAYNFTDKSVIISKGQRIAQMMVLPHEKIEFELVEKLDGKDRGGFGSTGTH